MTFREVLWTTMLTLCALRHAGAHEAAPSFTAKTLSGETFTSSSVRGSVVLLQFWTTWCPVCREDQPAVESIGLEFAAQGLIVLAVDVQEPEAKVREYLRERPRTCPIVLTRDTDLVARYKPHSFPLYIVLDRDGNVAGTQNGGGGEEALRRLLGRAGLPAPPENGKGNGAHNSASAESAKMIVLQPERGTYVKNPPPQAAAVFILSSGERVETRQYTLTFDFVRVTVADVRRTIPLTALDVKATLAANHERGIDLKIPASRHEIFLGH